MVSFLQSVTSRISCMAIGLGLAISELYAWLRGVIFRPSEQEAVSSSPEPRWTDSSDDPLTGLMVSVNRNGDWWELETRGPMRDISVVCKDYHTGIQELRRQVDDQCEQYDMSCQEEGYWRERETPST